MTKPVTQMFVPLKKAIISTYKTLKFITGTFNNIRAKGNPVDSVSVLSPYGHGSFPVTNMNAFISPVEDSNKQYFCLGFQNVIPPIDGFTPVEGESWNFSKKYTLVYYNTGLIAYRNEAGTYQATLVSGEWMGKILTDLIDDNNKDVDATSIRGWINTVLIPQLAAQSPPIVITPIAVNPTLTSDKTAITDNEILITDDGTLP